MQTELGRLAGYLRLARRWWPWLVACACAAAAAGFLVARSGSSRFPAGVRVVDVLSQSEFRKQPVTAVVTDRATVRRIEAWVNDMNAPSGGSYGCPYFGPGWPTVTLRFLASSNGRVLATAIQRNAVSGSGPCNPLNLRVPGHAVSRLIGGNFLVLQRLLGVDLGLGFGTVTGVIQRTRGTPGQSPAASSAGTVTAYGLVGSTGRRVSVTGATLPRPSDFKLTLPPGTYQLQAHLPKHPPDCKPTTITINAGQRLQLALPVGCSLM